MLYHLYDMHHMALTPLNKLFESVRDASKNPLSPVSYTHMGRFSAASADLMHRVTTRFNKPEFGLKNVEIGGKKYRLKEKTVLEKPFCELKHFSAEGLKKDKRSKVLLCSPLAGHYATLLRGTVEALLPEHDVYITDWRDARIVPLQEGAFDLDRCISYYLEFIRLLGPDVHLVAVCQPSVPVLAAVSLLAQLDDPAQPRSMTLMGGPIDIRVGVTEVNQHANDHDIHWYRRNTINMVPPWYPGAFRQVYPGFLQLTGFLSMNYGRHLDAHLRYFNHLIEGDDDSADRHRQFYDEYLSVMDLPAEFYLQTVERVFQKAELARGKFVWQGIKVKPESIKKTALMTVEGELDDISGPGQTEAAHKLANNLPASKRKHLLQKGAGHYGIFNGSKWRNFVRPEITKFIKKHAK